MPMLSKNQNGAMHAAAEGESTIGIPKSVGQKFVQESKGENIKALPQKTEQRKAVARAMMRR